MLLELGIKKKPVETKYGRQSSLASVSMGSGSQSSLKSKKKNRL